MYVYSQSIKGIGLIRYKISEDIFERFQLLSLHSLLLRESWLVFVLTLRLLICLNSARILAWADGWISKFYYCFFKQKSVLKISKKKERLYVIPKLWFLMWCLPLIRKTFHLFFFWIKKIKTQLLKF